MTILGSAEHVWIVVKVQSGIPVLAEAYQNQRTAMLREKVLRADMHLESDETGVFETRVARP